VSQPDFRDTEGPERRPHVAPAIGFETPAPLDSPEMCGCTRPIGGVHRDCTEQSKPCRNLEKLRLRALGLSGFAPRAQGLAAQNPEEAGQTRASGRQRWAATPGYRYWPVLPTVSIERPASEPFPEMSVRM
jgi:hypothetical protein